MKLLIVNSSHRKGNTDLAIKELLKTVDNTKFNIEVLVLRDIEMNLPDGCEKCAKGERCPDADDEFEQKWLMKIKDYDGILLVTPVWDNGPTPLLKIFIDRIVCYCNEKRMWLKDKKVGVIAHGMADEESWQFVADWVKSVCRFNKATFVGYYAFQSGASVGEVNFDAKSIKRLVELFKK